MASPRRAMQRPSDFNNPQWRCYRLHFMRKCAACKPPNLSTDFSFTPRLLDGFILAGDGPSWRQSVSHYSGDPWCSGGAQLSDDCAAHAHWSSLGSRGKYLSIAMAVTFRCSNPWHQSVRSQWVNYEWKACVKKVVVFGEESTDHSTN